MVKLNKNKKLKNIIFIIVVILLILLAAYIIFTWKVQSSPKIATNNCGASCGSLDMEDMFSRKEGFGNFGNFVMPPGYVSDKSKLPSVNKSKPYIQCSTCAKYKSDGPKGHTSSSWCYFNQNKPVPVSPNGLCTVYARKS
jgi:hypothetical protein